ncbi:ABC transporter ATP-binding protein [Aureibacillus halotolerans]|uniref:Iron complex transport system ATP-binding protein n=1 Tax=Aureibacillus halotolerans TaxID=1508390 RepID=A0A4V6PWI1_9BACI|nr:ABC transporter ATP-binding protein [Aureibacillus halotolerans]TDQ40327.1 iron complex transport system ATP-binding protein [Aureibacillus halotolerans]
MSIFSLDTINWQRNGRQILKDVSWRVEKGEKWVVFGKNGSGKTALLNIISGNMFPSSGDVKVFGETFGKFPLWEIRKRVGWVSSALQERLKSHESCLDIVVSGKFASIGIYEEVTQQDKEKATALLTSLSMEAFATHAYMTLSQGEKQRILLARALMADPELLILDEPCTGLDIPSRESLLQAVEDLSRESDLVVLYVTHHTEEVLPFFEKALLMHNGEIHKKGQTEDVFTSGHLSAVLDLPVEVTKTNGRYYTVLEKAEFSRSWKTGKTDM